MSSTTGEGRKETDTSANSRRQDRNFFIARETKLVPRISDTGEEGPASDPWGDVFAISILPDESSFPRSCPISHPTRGDSL